MIAGQPGRTLRRAPNPDRFVSRLPRLRGQSVAKQAAVAQGNPYVADGFSCSATPEGPVSRWSLAWGGTYYAYSCADGSLEVAFDWGTDYTYAG